MSMSDERIQLDYNQAIQQASKLKEIATNLARLHKSVQGVKETVASGWQDDAQHHVIGRIDTYAASIESIKKAIELIAVAIEETASIYLNNNKASGAPTIAPTAPGRPL